MTLITPIQPTRYDAPSVSSRFLDDVLRGLSSRRKTLPSKYFYDAEGSHNTDLDLIERGAIDGVLRDVGGNKSKAARRLGITRTQLYGRLRKHGLET